MKTKQLPKGIIAFSAIEMAIGLITLVTVTASVIFHFNTKPGNVLSFVYVASFLSFFLGIGLLTRNKQAYNLLLFLTGVVIGSKLLIFTDIIQLNGSLETMFPATLKNIVSILYHGALWVYLKQKNIKKLFNTS